MPCLYTSHQHLQDLPEPCPALPCPALPHPALPWPILPLSCVDGSILPGGRCMHSPGACQGREAEEEICEPPAAQPAVFQLVCGSDGVRQDIHPHTVQLLKQSTLGKCFSTHAVWLKSTTPHYNQPCFAAHCDGTSQCSVWHPGNTVQLLNCHC